MSIQQFDAPVVAEASYDIMSPEAQMAFLYALGHGATITEACKYANTSYYALIAQLDLGISAPGVTPYSKFSGLFEYALRAARGRYDRDSVTCDDLGRGTRFVHAEYIRLLRERQLNCVGVSVPHDEYYLDY